MAQNENSNRAKHYIYCTKLTKDFTNPRHEKLQDLKLCHDEMKTNYLFRDHSERKTRQRVRHATVDHPYILHFKHFKHERYHLSV